MSPSTVRLSPRGDAAAVEEGLLLAPKFDAAGLLTAVAVDASSGQILMVAHMNEEALRRTIETREGWYWSRSRASLWRKGDTSGQVQTVREILVDCDQDCLVLKVDVAGDGGCCHTGRRSCFYRRVELPGDGAEERQRPVALAHVAA
ncbi:phosphoribosyl-AMP cyclohydrolase [Alsobacter sp. KACC 23698]|uniref:Phosphoribosyl-AMP cyclohydrolase n=1 Tax=Alsobacter sp. KACC 23698 TaxID=3149229 RepID=A0AAU7JAN4_9HYPH